MKVKVKLRRTIKKGKKNSFEYTVVSEVFEGNWSSTVDHQTFRRMVRDKHGKSIVVYGPVKA